VSCARHSASVFEISVAIPRGYDGEGANHYAAITTLRAIIPSAAPARKWASTGSGLPAAWLALALLLAAHAALSLDGAAALEPAFAVRIGAAGMCLWRALGDRAERWAWTALAGALVLWTAGDAAGSDAAGIAGYPAAWLALVLLLRARVRGASRLNINFWLDGAIAALAVAATATAVLVNPLAEVSGSGTGAIAAGLAYPLGDLLLLGLAVGAPSLTSWRPGPSLTFIGLGLAASAIADTLQLRPVAAAPGILEAIWALGALLVAVAAWIEPPGLVARGELGSMCPGERRRFAIPACSAVAAIAIAVTDHHLGGIPALAVDLAALTLVLVLVRLGLSLRENARLLALAQREALTDSLTGLANRRALSERLESAVAAARAGDPQSLGLFDLDGFKHYNDTFGHPAGDALITRLSQRLRAAVGEHGAAFRMGGDEFCVLVPSRYAAVVLDRAALALSETGDFFRIRASRGTVDLPHDASDAAAALRLADRRMYAEKERGAGSPAAQSRDVLLRAMAEREPELHEHTEWVAELARRVAIVLELDAVTCESVARAAELHDVGKVAIPDTILRKPGPLDPDEREYMRRHSEIGEAIVRAAPALGPAAALVRASHERWDGRGYPDGLAGEAIPLGARIVAVCDAYSAMRQKRPYGEVLTDAQARAELRRCAGSQFDPRVVEAFCTGR
jgi:diguanylate cyclase (GGDEF)-like protein